MDAPVLFRRPLVVAALAFLAGVLIPWPIPSDGAPLWAASGALLRAGLSGRGLGAAAVGAAAVTLVLVAARSLVALVPFLLAFGLAGASARVVAAETSAELAASLTSTDLGPDPALEGRILGAVERGPDEDVYVVEVAVLSERRQASPPDAETRRRLARVHVPREGAGPPLCGRPGDRVRFVGTAVPWPTSGIAPRERPSWTVYAPRPASCVVLERATALGVGSTIERLRESVHAAIDRALDGDRAGLVRAFATGDRRGISRPTEENLRASGLAHLVAVSGLNLAIVAGLFVVALGHSFRLVPAIALGFGAQRTAALIAVPFVVAYTLLVGASPSAVRAAAMVLVLLVGHLLHRRRDALSALGLAAMVMLARDAGAIADPSFQLSFAAVLALFFIHPAIVDALPLGGRPAWVRAGVDVAAASVAAAIGTAPLVAYHFQSISLVGLLANVPAHPIASFVLVPLSLFGGLLGVVSDRAARPILQVAGLSAEALIRLARVSASAPGATISVPPPTLVEGALFLGLVGVIVSRERLYRARRVAIGLSLALVLEIAGLHVMRLGSRELRMTVLPVGQGDAIVLELPGGHVVVVDTGPTSRRETRGPDALAARNTPNAADRIVAPFLRARRIGAIDLLVLTHPHADHVGGFVSLARAFPIQEVWWTGDRREGPEAILDAIADHPGLRLLQPGQGDVRRFGAARLERLGPTGAPRDWAIVNDGSIVLRVVLGDRAFLLAGDAERAEEEALVGAGGLRADVLKLGHHGSRTSSTESFLDAVRPELALVSAGRRNVFGFPHPEVLERLEARKIRVLRTDLDGALEVVTDGARLEARVLGGRP